MEILRNFAVFEGGDGSGTSTQLSILEQKFAKNIKNSPVFYPTYEPTGGKIGQLIRSALKKELVLQPDALAMLFAADRSEHLFAAGGVYSRCRHGELVVCDRYIPSSLVYQGIECGEALPRSLNSSFPAPELLFFFDVDPETAMDRLKQRPSLEMYERIDFQKKVRERYQNLLGEYRSAGIRVEIIDASQDVEKVAEDVWSALLKMPIFKEVSSG
ncbi:MAG: dTMP kinase [Treponema sp.]|nr:dTMP kinase [Treponema sp.]